MDGNCGPLTEVKVSCGRGSMVERFRSSRPVMILFYFIFLNLKLPIVPFSYFVIQFNIKTFGIKLMI